MGYYMVSSEYTCRLTKALKALHVDEQLDYKPARYIDPVQGECLVEPTLIQQ